MAREAGSRSKVAVYTENENVDPIGSCVGQKGARIQTIINELGGEKIDIIEYDDDPEKFIINALSPAKISNIEINEEEKRAAVHVATDQLSLAIGKGGQNARLAARLTGWKIDIIEEGSKTEQSQEEDSEPKEQNEEKEEQDKEKPEPKEQNSEAAETEKEPSAEAAEESPKTEEEKA